MLIKNWVEQLKKLESQLIAQIDCMIDPAYIFGVNMRGKDWLVIKAVIQRDIAHNKLLLTLFGNQLATEDFNAEAQDIDANAPSYKKGLSRDNT